MQPHIAHRKCDPRPVMKTTIVAVAVVYLLINNIIMLVFKGLFALYYTYNDEHEWHKCK